MKIVIDARTLGSKPSGIGMYAFNYIRELIKSEYQVILLTDVAVSEEMEFLKAQDVEVIEYGVSTYRSAQILKYFDFVRKQLLQIQPELFWEPNILIPRRLSGYKGKVMITIHDMFPVTHVQYFGWKYGLYFRVMLKRTIKKTDIILYDSRETRAETEKFCPMAKRKKNYIQYVIVPGTEEKTSQQEEEKGKLEEKSRIEEAIQDKDYFLYVGNMEKRKGVDLLLDAYEEYVKKGGKKELILAGKKREEDIDAKIAEMTQKYEKVTYYGYVSEADKRSLYEHCACFLFPSMAEGFGICVIEAMNYYKPVIVSDLSIFREIAGESVKYFSLEGSRKEQVERLSSMMSEYQPDIDKSIYDGVINSYSPESLGKKIVDVLNIVW